MTLQATCSNGILVCLKGNRNCHGQLLREDLQALDTVGQVAQRYKAHQIPSYVTTYKSMDMKKHDYMSRHLHADGQLSSTSITRASIRWEGATPEFTYKV